MYAGTNKDIYHAPDEVRRHPQFAGKQLGIIVISYIYAVEKFLAVFPAFRACVHLIHKAMFSRAALL